MPVFYMALGTGRIFQWTDQPDGVELVRHKGHDPRNIVKLARLRLYYYTTYATSYCN